MEHNDFLYYLGNLICKIADAQLNKFFTFFLKFIVTLFGTFTILMIFFKAIDQSLTERAFQGFFNSTYLGEVMIKYSSTDAYQLLLRLTIPFLLLFGLIIGPFFLTLFKCLEPCEDYRFHKTNEEYNQDKTLKRLTDNLIFEKYTLSYGTNRVDHEDMKDTYYIEAFRANQKLFSKDNIFIRVYVYPYVSFHRKKPQIERQLEDSYATANKLFTRHGKGKRNFILPIFIVEDTDLQTKRFIVEQYRKEGSLRILPVLYSGSENWWFHKRAKRPFILSILKILERNEKRVTNEEFERNYQEANYFLKGNGYSYYQYGLEYMEKGKYKQALKQFKYATKYAKTDRDKSHGYFLIGACHNHLHSKDESIEALQTAINIQPKNYNALGLLALVYSKHGDYEKALPYFEQYLTAFPINTAFICDYAYAYIHLGQYANAIPLLTRALEIAPTNIEILSQLSLSYAGIGDRAMAERHVEKVFESGLIDIDYLLSEVEEMLEEYDSVANPA